MDLERENLAEIEALNQRGGRSLSVLDLIEAGTVSAEMAAFCWLAVAGGDSFLTGALPGGAGKTTLMAALLGFLPPGERIVTVASREEIEQALEGRFGPPAGQRRPAVTLLPHEIGRAPIYGYLWGQDAADFLALTARGVRCVCCLHADDPEQTREQLLGLGVSPDDLARVGLLAYMLAERHGRAMRHRVRTVHVAADGGHRLLYEWDAGRDAFTRTPGGGGVSALLAARLGVGPSVALRRWRECSRLLDGWLGAGVRRFDEVRARVVDAYGAWAEGGCARGG